MFVCLQNTSGQLQVRPGFLGNVNELETVHYYCVKGSWKEDTPLLQIKLFNVHKWSHLVQAHVLSDTRLTCSGLKICLPNFCLLNHCYSALLRPIFISTTPPFLPTGGCWDQLSHHCEDGEDPVQKGQRTWTVCHQPRSRAGSALRVHIHCVEPPVVKQHPADKADLLERELRGSFKCLLCLQNNLHTY